MFAAERMRKIRELLLEYNEVDINTLCSMFSASVSTVRRDLDKLEESGFLRRSHGGAVLSESVLQRENADSSDFADDKNTPVAALAACMMRDGEIIFLGGGSICHSIAKVLRTRWTGTVVTNNLAVINELCGRAGIEVITLGGSVTPLGNMFVTEGPAALSAIENTIVNKAFVSVSGVSVDFGYFMESAFQAELVHRLKKNALELICVLNSEKFDRIGKCRFEGLDYFKKVVSNPDVPDAYKQYFFDNDITLFTSFTNA